jgi:hypothetical protein
MDTNNVVNFPRIKSFDEEVPTTVEEAALGIEMIKHSYFDSVSVELAGQIFTRASICGFNVSKQEAIKDCILVVEAIKSLLMKVKGEYYSIQDLAENIKCDEEEPEIFINEDAYFDD